MWATCGEGERLTGGLAWAHGPGRVSGSEPERRIDLNFSQLFFLKHKFNISVRGKNS
jgi:hypothetical protein